MRASMRARFNPIEEDECPIPRLMPGRRKTIVRHGLLVVCYAYMYTRNREILGPVIRAYGSKDREQATKSRPTDAARRDHNPPRPRQLSLLDK